MSALRGGRSDLLAIWTASFGSLADALGRDLLDRYAEPHRRYHDAAHLVAVLSALRQLHPVGACPPAVIAAAFWHDAVYDPTASDNELRSADLAVASMTALGLDPSLVEEVRRLVLLTASHAPAPGDEPGALLCDADLAVLGADTADYARYAAGIRSEYAHLSDALFRVGRAAVLRSLLDRRWLYSSDIARGLWEAAARRNMQAEIALLSAASDDEARPV